MPRSQICPEPPDLSSSQESIYSSVVQRSQSDIRLLRVIRRMVGHRADGSRENEEEIETSKESRCSSTSSGSTLEPVWELRATPKSPPKTAPTKAAPSNAPLREAVPLKAAPRKGVALEAATPKVAPRKVALPKASPPKVALPKVALPKVAPPKASPPKVDPPKVALPKVALPKVASTKASPPKVAPPKVALPKVTPPNATLPKASPPKTASPNAPLREAVPSNAAPHTQPRAPHAGTNTNNGVCGCQARKGQHQAEIVLLYPGHPALGYRPTPRSPVGPPLHRVVLPPLLSTRFQQAPRTTENQSQTPTQQAPVPSDTAITNATEVVSPAEMKEKIIKMERRNDVMDLMLVTRQRKLAELQILDLDVRGLPAKIEQRRKDHDFMIKAWEGDRLQPRDHEESLTKKKSKRKRGRKNEGRDVAARPMSNGLKRTSTFNFLSPDPLSSHGGQSDSDSLHSNCSSFQERCPFPHTYIPDLALPRRNHSHEPPSIQICATSLAVFARRDAKQSPPARVSMYNIEDSDEDEMTDSDCEDSSIDQEATTQRIKELQYLVLTTEKKLEIVKELEKDSGESYKKEKKQLARDKKHFQNIKKSMPSDLKRSTKEKLKVLEAEIEQGQKRVVKELKQEAANLKAVLNQHKKALKDEEKKKKERQKRLEKQQKEKAKEEKLKLKKRKEEEKEEEKKLQMELAKERKIEKARLMAEHKKDKWKKLKRKVSKKKEEEECKRAWQKEKYDRRREKRERRWTKRIRKATKIKNKITSAPGRFFRLFKPSYGKKVDKMLKERQVEQRLWQETELENEQWLAQEERRKKQDVVRVEEENNERLEERWRALAAKQEANEWGGKMRTVLSTAKGSTSRINLDF